MLKRVFSDAERAPLIPARLSREQSILIQGDFTQMLHGITLLAYEQDVRFWTVRREASRHITFRNGNDV